MLCSLFSVRFTRAIQLKVFTMFNIGSSNIVGRRVAHWARHLTRKHLKTLFSFLPHANVCIYTVANCSTFTYKSWLTSLLLFFTATLSTINSLHYVYTTSPSPLDSDEVNIFGSAFLPSASTDDTKREKKKKREKRNNILLKFLLPLSMNIYFIAGKNRQFFNWFRIWKLVR